jgi:hypothetical protein
MSGVAPVRPKQYFPNTSGAPLVSGTVDVYRAGTTTRTDTWRERTLIDGNKNTNPIVLDARGECSIWLDPAITYKFVVKDALGVTQYTEDNVSGGGSGSSAGLNFRTEGADSTGVADASTEITATFTAGQTGNQPIRVAGETYKITSPVLLPYHVDADWGNATIDGSSIAAGQWAITAKNKSGLTNFQRPSMWKGLRLDLGVSSTAYGVKIEAPTGQWAVSDFAAETWLIKGGAKGLGFGQNTWLVNLRNIEVTGQSEVGIDTTTGTNAGEGLSFYAGVIGNVNNGGATGIGVLNDYNPLDAGGGTVKFFGTSFDYSDVQIHHRHGLMELHGCHIEGDGAHPLVKVEQVAGRSVASFHAFGSVWYSTPGSTRTKVVEIIGNPVVNIHGGECIAIANTESLEFVSVPSGALPQVNIRGVSFNLFPGMSQTIGRICGYTSLVRNGDFETGTLASWGMDAVNFIRNGGWSGGVTGTIGAGGAWPTDMGLVGALNGLNQPILTFVTDRDRPVMRVRFSGTPTASSSTGVYFYNGTGIASAQNDLWKLRSYARLVGTPVGVDSYSFQITERDSGGAAAGASSTFITPTANRDLHTFSHTTAQATADHIQPSFIFSFTNAVAVDFTIEFDIPSLMLAPMVYEDIVRIDTAATLPTYRVQAPAAGGRTAAKALKLYSTDAQTVDMFALVPVKTREWLLSRGYAHITARTAGEVGLKLSWRDWQDEEISAQNVRPTYLSTTGSYLQQSGVRVAPIGTERARLSCHLEAFNGTVLFDDIEAWVV